MNSYEEKKQARIERYRQRSGTAQQRSNALCDESHKMMDAIPFGQPIHVGHYSEQRDRNYRARAGAKMDKAIDEMHKAKYYEQKAEAAENNTAISSDDPEALVKLNAKLDELTANHEKLKAENKRRRSAGEEPLPWYALPYSSAEIRRVKERIAKLEKVATSERIEAQHEGFAYVENVEENRVQFVFDGKPSEEARQILKGWGFRWARSVSAWQRMLNENGKYAAKKVMQKLAELENIF